MQGKLLAGVSAKVQLYRWAQRDDGSRELVNECNHAGHVYVLYMATRGDFILVGALTGSHSASLRIFNSCNSSSHAAIITTAVAAIAAATSHPR